MNLFTFLWIIGCLLFSIPSYGKSGGIQDLGNVLYIGGNFQFTDTAADDVAGATYQKKMVNPAVAVAGLGFRLFNLFYLGVRYEYWFASRDFTVSGVNQVDTLKYQSLGGEFGFYRGNPRMHWTLTAGWFHPLDLSVESNRAGTSSTYTHEPKPVTYQARLTISLKLSNRMSLRLEGGYRYANFGDMSSASSSLLQNGEKLDLSGPFAGAGFGLHF